MRPVTQAVMQAVTGDSSGSLYGNDMVLVMATTTPDETVTIPCQNVGTFDAVIDWGDGSTSTITAYNDANLAHVYADIADYTIRISGTFPNIHFNNGGDRLKLRQVLQLGSTGLTRLDNAFYGCSNMIEFLGGVVDTSAVTTFLRTFLFCSGLVRLNVSGWNISATNTIEQIFRGCSSVVTIDVSGWDTGGVTVAGSIFRGCSSVVTIDVSGWDTGLFKNVEFLFANCTSLADAAIDGWAIENITNYNSFMAGATLPTTRYNATLIAWNAQNPNDSESVDFGNSQYSGSAAATARQNLIDNDLWTISDGGLDPTDIGIVVGDSFSDGAADWPTKLLTGAQVFAAGGNTLVGDIQPAYAGHIAARAETITFSIIQGGVNDFTAGNLVDIKAAVTSMVDTAKAAFLDVAVVGVSPWSANAYWNASRQTMADDYNAWLAAQATIQGFTYIDIYTPLESGTTPDELAAAYDSGDGLHPNGAGMDVIADLADTAIANLV